jgi:hypothetical protein
VDRRKESEKKEKRREEIEKGGQTGRKLKII